MSMLDTLTNAGAASPAPPGSGAPLMPSNRALRAARDAVDAHHVWELDPATIVDDRLSDRLDPSDVHDLRDAIETNGQTVPILVRRHPSDPDRFLLVYGRRRLEAIRGSDKVTKVRALVASLDDDAALRAQISENMARRDLSFIERALFARELVETGFGNQSQVAEVLTVTKSSVSMALAIVETVSPDLAQAIGPAHGIGRPKWEALGRMIEDTGADRKALITIADQAHDKATVALIADGIGALDDPSVLAFEAVQAALAKRHRPAARASASARTSGTSLSLAGRRGGTVKRTAKGVSINIENSAFADWIEAEAQALIDELHDRWTQRSED